MADGQHYLVIDFQGYLAQECLNVWMFEANGTDCTAVHVSETFLDKWVNFVTILQPESLVHTGLNVFNQEDPADFSETTLNVPGTVSGEGLPSFACYSIMFRRATRAVRNGWKRIPGVPESGQANGELVTSFKTGLDSLCTDLMAGLTHPTLDCHLTAKIWRRSTLTTPAEYFNVAGFDGSAFVTTQNTRKPGRGS